MSTVVASRPLRAPAAGRTRVTAKALNRVIAAVAAEALGVDASSVSIDLADSAGALTVTVRSPLRVVSLGRVQDDRGIVARTGGTLLERAAVAQTEIRRRASDLSGSNISTVTVRLTGIDVQSEKRVR
ncbi:hypothetical protein [Subtercola boreus]|uniref:NTP pyrophosphohydrolase n=1 Tax=Subtercola boreus TaxID=120213 RepID=A0A3E0WFP6_9MICO|nr:hypothetical protein [Subtercola boreus]RFA23348.1 hypothetical protein B7R24_00095 [Subtercola boreus]RFA23741.1 hypothetical protein B7R23_00095 [Subtercola boreus]RFA29441.1 hypothetical protein B7R25_00090 [Subtercola boreus]